MKLMAMFVGLAFAVPAHADDVADVRAVLQEWAAANAAHDVDRAVGLWSQSFVNRRDSTRTGLDGVRALIGETVAGRHGAVELQVADAEITVSDGSATAEGVLALTEWGAYGWSYELIRDPGGWRLLWMEPKGRVEVERALPGLGAPYVELLELWSGTALRWIDSILVAHPANGGDPAMRMHAHLMLDEPLHLRSATSLTSVQRFLRGNIDRALGQMRTEEVADGVTIWKLYNHGFVVKTANHCWAHDLYAGPDSSSMTDEQIDGILDQVEALFCSHWHGDHSSAPVIARALARGIPVLVSPLPEGEWGVSTRERVGGVTGPDGAPRHVTVVELGGSGNVGEIAYHAYPGHQGDMPNDVFVVSADGMTVMQTGDQSNDDDFAWIDSVDVEYDVDVLLPNVWTTDISRMIDGVKPRVVVPGHENELGHNFEHREPYAQAYERLEGVGCDWHVLAWGERVHIGARQGD